MKIILDEWRCDGHGVCVDACPQVFAMSEDDDMVTVLIAEPDESLREDVNRAVDICPKAAITVEG